ncbi:hypothetical protein FB99_46420 (plasmid) [Pantoea agglomerans]|nr:hypothetical protein FB99_46420 [Pantoea agglomerans]
MMEKLSVMNGGDSWMDWSILILFGALAHHDYVVARHH